MIDKGNVVYTHSGILFKYKEKWCNDIPRKIYGIENNFVSKNKPDPENTNAISYMKNLN